MCLSVSVLNIDYSPLIRKVGRKPNTATMKEETTWNGGWEKGELYEQNGNRPLF